MQTETTLQPHMGRPVPIYKPQDNIGGYMALAKVTRVHHKYNTVDVQIIKTSNRISSSPEQEGKHGAKLGVSTAHYNANTMSSSGVIEPIQEGQLVVVGYLDNLKSEPFIICSFHNTWETTKNVLPDKYPIGTTDEPTDYREALKYLRVFPSQSYFRVDGVGSLEYSHPSGSFLVIDNCKEGREVSDTHDMYTTDDLHEKDPFTNKTRGAVTEESLFPSSWLLQHKCVGDVFLKIFLSRFGDFAISLDA